MVLRQTAHHAVGQAVVGSVGAETATVPPAQATLLLFHLPRTAVPDARAHPDPPLPIFQQTAHPVVGQAVVGGVGFETLTVPPTQAAPGADPQLPLSVFQDGTHADKGLPVGRVVGHYQSVFGAVGFKALAVPAVQATPGTDPQPAVLVLQQAPYIVMEQPVGRGVVLEGRAVVAADTSERAEPQPTRPIFHHGPHPVVDQTIGGSQAEQLGAVVAAGAPFPALF